MPLHTAFLSLGSNSADAPLMLQRARFFVGLLPGVEVLSSSRVYRTEPQDCRQQPWFHNQVMQVQIQPSLTPSILMDMLLALEQDLGRIRNGIRFGPRCIDIDILLFDREVSTEGQCILPHPRMHRRAFVLVPLGELAPRILIGARTPAQWLAGLSWHLEQDKIYQTDT